MIIHLDSEERHRHRSCLPSAHSPQTYTPRLTTYLLFHAKCKCIRIQLFLRNVMVMNRCYTDTEEAWHHRAWACGLHLPLPHSLAVLLFPAQKRAGHSCIPQWGCAGENLKGTVKNIKGCGIYMHEALSLISSTEGGRKKEGIITVFLLF